MKVIPVIVGALGTTPSRLQKKTEGDWNKYQDSGVAKDCVIAFSQNPQESA